MPSPWIRSPEQKGIIKPYSTAILLNCVVPFDIKLSSGKKITPLTIVKTIKGSWKFHGWEASEQISPKRCLLLNVDNYIIVSLHYVP